MKRLIAVFLVVSLVAALIVPVSAGTVSGASVGMEVEYSPELVDVWDNYFHDLWGVLGGEAIGFVSSGFVALCWASMSGALSTAPSGYGLASSLEALHRRAYAFNTQFEAGVYSAFGAIHWMGQMPHAEVMWVENLNAYVICDTVRGIPLITTGGAYAYYREKSPQDKWIGSKSCDVNGKVVILSEDVLADLCLTLNQAGETCSLTKWGDKYLVIAKDQYFYYCNPDGIPYVFRVDQNYAVDSPNNYYTNDEGDNIYNGGDVVNTTLIDNSSSVVWFPDGTFQYIDQLIYDESTKTYYVDAHTEYNTTNNTYVSNSYSYTYHIDYTSITYIGSTAEYDKEYYLYYELPDGRSSADLTAEDLEVLNVSMDMIPYVRTADDASIRALYHFDGDTLDSSYWSYTGALEWVKGASITYMEANAFNGALYLDENEHEFVVQLPGNLGSGDFTIQFRYYASHTETPYPDSWVQLGNVNLLTINGARFISSAGDMCRISTGNWQDVCIMRKDGVLYGFVNGVCYASALDQTIYDDVLRFVFGSSQQTYKYLDELRVLNKAAYDPAGYTPSSVPFDTNLALVLPDTVTPLADEYWKFNAEGNLFRDYNWVGSSVNTEIFSSGHMDYSGTAETRWYYTQGSKEDLVVNVRTDSVRLTAPGSSKALSIPFYFSSGNPCFDSSVSLGRTYTFSIMLADGSIHSVTVRPNAIPVGFSARTNIPGGGSIAINHVDLSDEYGEEGWSVYLLQIVPPANGSLDIVYVELKEGETANTGHEFVSAVAAIDNADLDKATLAVRTDLEINGHQIGGVRPSLPTKGLVWALVEAGRITSLQIYNGQAWEAVDGRIWTGSRWIPYYAFDVLLLKDMYDVVESDPTMNPIYTETGFWKWLQDAWGQMLAKLDQIIEGLSGGANNCKHEYEVAVDREPDCVLHGSKSSTCRLCGYVLTETIPAVGHNWTVTDHVGGELTNYAFVDTLAECVDPAVQYVLPDGSIYAYIDTGIVQSRLPDGYTELEWIQSNGSQFIDTKYIADSASSVIMDCQVVGLSSMEVGQGFFGARTTTTRGAFLVYYQTESKTYIYRYGDGTKSYDTDFIFDRIVISANSRLVTVGNAISIRAPAGSFVCTYPLYLFGINHAGSFRISSSLRLFSCQIYSGSGALVRDYIPCLNASGEVGLFDAVSGVFFGNGGTGSFEGGPEVAPAPVFEWTVVGRYVGNSGGYDVLTCSVCGAMARDYGQGPVYIQVPSESGDDNWTLVDVFVICKDGVWSFMTGIVRTAFGGLSGFVTGLDSIGGFFDAYQTNRGNEIFGIYEYEGADIWD